jgi:hypothetical protein
MIVSTGLGDDSGDLDLTDLSPDSGSTVYWAWGAIGLGAILLVNLFKGKKRTTYRVSRAKQTRVSRTATRARVSKPKSSGMSQDEKDAIDGLIGQGASKSQAKAAVAKAKSQGASGFNELFKRALSQLT